MWSGQTRSYKNQQQVSHCGMHADFFITWKDHTITVRHGLKSNGSVFLTWTRRWDLWSFSDIRLGTIEEGELIFYPAGTFSTSDEETLNITTFDNDLFPTDEPRPSQNTSANYLSTLSVGTSIPSQRTVTEILTMFAETTEVVEIKTTDGMTTTSGDLQSTITIGDTEISDTSAKSASTISTSIPLELVTTPSSYSMVGTEPSNNTCECNCPKASVTPINNGVLDQLKIDKKTLSSYKRRRKSATDPRNSSFYIGCVGITVLVISVAFIVLLDCIPRA
ncbi:Hypothetical predicted protein [Mytilus galloprovincialis]|uniref:Farnesoic acid O-methyl transferase domain-containing protein n=1 Tax=Mytilus galloprovincialis TaxID=29158 RepID=A0A8B6CGL4_MYTGA|nr:Hypothetical predicted protein [Mytilus galloprovincialis]